MQTLTIEQALALAAVLNKTPEALPSGIGNGRPVIVRCRDAGVWFGNLVSYQGREVKITNGRRMWYWKPASGMTLSACALSGVSAESKIAEPVSDVTLLEACEILTCTYDAAKSIGGSSWKK